MRFTDPDGMAPTDWVNKGNKYIWDDRVVDQKTATKFQGGGAKYIGKSADVYSKMTANQGSGATYTDKVTLGKDGSVSVGVRKDGYANFETQATLKTGTAASVTNFNGSEFTPRQTGGTYAGASLGFAFLGGAGISAGVVTDATGNSKPYFTFSGNVGVGLGASLDFGVISPTGNNQFTTGDFKGASASYNGGILFVGGSKGGSIDSGLPGASQMSTKNFGTNQNGYTTVSGSVSVGADAGLMFSHGQTWVGN